jgi:hypothetical protein
LEHGTYFQERSALREPCSLARSMAAASAKAALDQRTSPARSGLLAAHPPASVLTEPLTVARAGLTTFANDLKRLSPEEHKARVQCLAPSASHGPHLSRLSPRKWLPTRWRRFSPDWCLSRSRHARPAPAPPPRALTRSQVSLIREGVAAVYEAEESWSLAAQTLAGIELDSGQRVLESSYKLEKCVKIAQLYLEDDDALSAETFIKKAAFLVADSNDEALERARGPSSPPRCLSFAPRFIAVQCSTTPATPAFWTPRCVRALCCASPARLTLSAAPLPRRRPPLLLPLPAGQACHWRPRGG